MQLESLKVFCDIVRLHSISKAAVENTISQSMASQTLMKLEKHLSISLIDRSFRPWKLTAEGKVFYDGCHDVVERYYKLENKLKQNHDERVSIVRVASIYSVGLRHMNQFVDQYAELYSQAQAHMEYLHPDKVYESIIQEEADIGIVSFPQSKRDVNVIPWRQEPMVVACHPEHRLVQQKKVQLRDIADEKFVGFNQGLVIRREIDRFLKQNEVDVNIDLEFDNIESIKRAVEIGSGISILPRPTLDREIQSGSLCALPFATTKFVRPLGIIHRKGRKFNLNITQFIELLQSEKSTSLKKVALT